MIRQVSGAQFHSDGPRVRFHSYGGVVYFRDRLNYLYRMKFEEVEWRGALVIKGDWVSGQWVSHI